MKIDKSKMSAEEQATLAEFEKKYGIADDASETGTGTAPAIAADDGIAKTAPANTDALTTATVAPEMHPEVKKALADMEEVRKAQTAEIEELKKSLEVERLASLAKKYEAIGKKAEELAPKLYELKKAGGTAYDDYIALLDEHLNTVEKSGLFAEYGRNTGGSAGIADKIGIAAAEIAKAGTGVTNAAAIAKAYSGTDHPFGVHPRRRIGG